MIGQAIGIDWGFRGATQMALVEATPEGNEVVLSVALSGRTYEEIIGCAATILAAHPDALLGLSNGNPFSNEVLLRSFPDLKPAVVSETRAFLDKDLRLKTPTIATVAMRLAVEALERQAAK